MISVQRLMQTTKWHALRLLPKQPRSLSGFRPWARSSARSTTTTSDNSLDPLVASTRAWFETVVLGQKLCPFAAPLVSKEQPDKLRIVASRAADADRAVADVTREAHFLLRGVSTQHHPETTLVVFDHTFLHDFRDFVRLSWTFQDTAVVGPGFAGELQLVLFHPAATHQTYGADTASPADYTIRSPYPTVHLLREVDVVQAVQSGYPNLADLPNRNKAKFVAQGVEVCQERLEQCYVGKPKE